MEEEYLNYGQNKISKSELMNNLASLVTSYVKYLPWSQERKNMFMSAYSEILSRGVTGASNSTGIWQIQYGGDPIDLSGKSDKEREMYGEAAYFIQQLMNGLKPIQEQQKANLPVLTNQEFTSKFNNYIANLDFGGNDFNVGGEKDDWNKLDPRNEKGIRGTENRREKLANYLVDFKNTINDDTYSFEGSPFKDLTDFLTRINDAIYSLRSNTNVESALNRIGIRAADWLNNGENDTFVDKNGKTWTYKDYNNREIPKPKIVKKLYNIVPTNIKLNGWNRHQIANLGSEGISLRLDKIFRNPNNSNGDDLSFLRGLGTIIDQGIFPTQELTDDEFKDISKLPRFKGSKRNRFRKVRPGLYYDTTTKQWITPKVSVGGTMDDFVELNKLTEEDKLNENMNTPISQMKDLSPEMSRELRALAWDLGAFVDPEAITGTGMALRAAYLRELNRPEGFSWGRILDWGTAAMGGLPVLGDLLSVGKPLYRLSQLIKGSAKFLGYLSTALGAIGATNAIEPLKKLATSPTSLTPQDVENLAYGLMGLVGGIKTVRAVRSGNAYTQSKKGAVVGKEHTLEIQTKEGTKKTIKLSDEEAKAISDTYKSAKNNNEANLKVLDIIKNKVTNVDLTGAKVLNTPSSIRGSRVGRYLREVPTPVRSKTIYSGNSNEAILPSWLSMINPVRAKILDKAVIPEPSNIPWYKRYHNAIFGDYSITPKSKTSLSSNSTSQSSTSSSNTPKTWNEIKQGPNKWKMSDEAKEYRNMLNENFSNNAIRGGEFSAGDYKFNVDIPYNGANQGFVEVSFGGNTQTIRFDSQKLLQQAIAKIIKSNRVKIDSGGKKIKQTAKETAEILRLLKARGLFKRGGQINKSLQDTISEFLNKQK